MYINTYTHRSEAYRFKLKAVHKFTFFQALCVGAMARVWWVFLPEVGGWMTVSGDEERGDRFSTTCGRRFSYSLQFKGSHTHYAFIVNRSKTAAWPIYYTLIQGRAFAHMIKIPAPVLTRRPECPTWIVGCNFSKSLEASPSSTASLRPTTR